MNSSPLLKGGSVNAVHVTKWTGCYDSSWKGLITPASFAHPAKFSFGLIERIFNHCLAMGYLKKGDRVGDAFGGIGTGGIVAAYRGLEWVGVELESRFVAFANDNFALHRRHWEHMGLPLPRIIQGDSRCFAEKVAGVVTSPPYADSIDRPSGIDPDKVKKPGGPNGNTHMDIYGEASGQIGSLKSGQIEAVISSPPYAGTSGQGGGGINVNGYKPAPGRKWTHPCGNPDEVGKRTYQGQGGDRSAGNIETLKEGTVQAVVSSPPYSDIAAGAGGLNTKPAKKPGQQSGRKAESASQDTDQRYGTSTGQISQLKGGSVDGVVSSPPFEGCGANLGDVGDTPGQRQEISQRSKPRTNAYGGANGQIGNESGETYWQAVDAVYRSCFKCIKPGGYLILVLKDYCKAGKRVRLCDDTMRLLEHIGFQPLERIHAMLVTETVENGLFGDEKTKRQRKSFFRRLYEARLPENDDRRIDFEEVLICSRP